MGLRLVCLAALLWLLAGCHRTANKGSGNAVSPLSHSSASKSPSSSPSDTNALFQNVTEQAGIRFRHENGAEAGKFQFLETTPAGCAFFDYDNDGWIDILLLQSGTITPDPNHPRPHCALYHNNGNGTFTDVTAGSGLDKDLGYAHGVAVGDYDNDGYDDLFLTSYGHNFLFHNERRVQGSGFGVPGQKQSSSRSKPFSGGVSSPEPRTLNPEPSPLFRDVTKQMGLDKIHSTGYATSAAFGDYDNDGKLDLYVCYYCPWTPQTDKICHDTNNRREYCSPAVYATDTHVLYHNEGGHFRDVSHVAGIDKVQGRGLAVAFLDYDEDGKQDIFVANDISGNMLWHNEGNGRFVEKGTEVGVRYGNGGSLMAGMGVAIGDYDNSGHESLFVTNFDALPNMLFKNTGKGFMDDVTVQSGVGPAHLPFLSFGCEFLDYDADGWPDLLIADGHVQLRGKDMEGMKQRKQLLHNERNGAVKEITDAGLLGDMNRPTIARGLAIGDFDNDGRPDALFSNQNDSPQLYRNQDKSGHHWVSFKTIGTRSNRDGLHTRFVVSTGGQKRLATVRAGSSYLSVSDRRVWFGLGETPKIDRVEVFWPSGTKDTLTNVAPDAGYIVTEGRGITGRQPTHRIASGSAGAAGGVGQNGHLQ